MALIWELETTIQDAWVVNALVYHSTLRLRVIERRRLGFREVDIRLSGKGNSNPHGARPVY